ncbi:pyridoxamine 5'-phosphate oxidase family protein [Bacteroidota bacterium]
MRKKNQEITDPVIIEEILQESEICRLAMMDGDRPYILPFNYGYHDHCIYIHCAPKGKKIDLLQKNPEVCFEIEHSAELIEAEKACKWSELYRSVIGYGKVEIITDFEQILKGLEIIMRSNGAQGPLEFDDKHVKACSVLKMQITSITAKQSSNWDKIRS